MHVPVMLNETIDSLAVKPGGVYVDGTLGRAGHTLEIIRRTGGDCTIIGIDRDGQALEESRARLEREAPGADVRLIRGGHGALAETVRSAGFEGVDGVLLDLGVSSPQLDEAERGFSFRKDGPLDMRMDRSGGATAAELVNRLDEGALVEILRSLGEEPNARRIARAIVRRRAERALAGTLELAELVERAVGRRGAHHPATRTFQALRMAVNDETGELERALAGALEILKRGGRISVITFESLTDRLVKRFFAAHAGRIVSLQQGGERWEGELPRVRCVARKAATATEAEVAQNPRSRSAKLRAAEKV